MALLVSSLFPSISPSKNTKIQALIIENGFDTAIVAYFSIFAKNYIGNFYNFPLGVGASLVNIRLTCFCNKNRLKTTDFSHK